MWFLHDMTNIIESTTRDDIRELMDHFYHNEYHSKSYSEKQALRWETEYLLSSPPNRYRVSLFQTGRGEDRQLNAAVEVKYKYWQMKAIQLLDGQAYGYCIMKVEKSIPRKKRWWLINSIYFIKQVHVLLAIILLFCFFFLQYYV